MENYQIHIIDALLRASVLIWLIPAMVLGIRRAFFPKLEKRKRKSSISRILIFSACIIGSVWCLRYAVGYYTIHTAHKNEMTLTWLEEVFNSLSHALQTFSMDEDYQAYILSGKQMLRQLLGANTWTQHFYGIYASLLNFVAPIAGGAILFEMLASIFPRIRLQLSYLAVWKEKYYFSELNAASLALAKSILDVKAGFGKKPVIIFTDVYVDKEEEKRAEMLMEAKALGAVCIRDDVAHVKKNHFGGRKFFLIDENETGNLKTLVDLATSENCHYLKGAEIYHFTSDDAYIQVENRIRDKLTADFGFTKEELPIFVPVQSYRNLICNLLVEVPLYEPLIGKKPNQDGTKDLTVTILGSGYIGREMFLSTYWFGQILDCNLKINVLSQETEDEFWGRIDYVNPEIRRTTRENDPILQINRKGDMSAPYCRVQYTQCDMRSSAFVDLMTDPGKQILDTDYYLVALGSDADNISVANSVRKFVGQHHIQSKNFLRTVIAYVVYDPELASTLNRKLFFPSSGAAVDIYMQAIGGLPEVYSVRNVFMTDHIYYAQKAEEAYATIQKSETRQEKHRARLDNDYKYWANLARGMHLKYKIYSLGLLEKSLFDLASAPEAYTKLLEDAYTAYEKIATGQADLQTPEQEQAHLTLLHRMAWLEHRRWCAFTRVKGFRGCNAYDVYATPGKDGSYKQMELKLHPCLVECDQNGVRGVISAQGVVDESTLFQAENKGDFDFLDELTYDTYRKGYNSYDFKVSDYRMPRIGE